MADTGHGGKEIVERILEPAKAVEKIEGLKSFPIRSQIADEVIDIAYGWFTLTSLTFWDMRYAGPREAVFHAMLRANLGLTHHMFGRDHAGVGSYYGPYDAHHLLATVQDDLSITPVYSMNWLYCPHCGEITSEGLCNHRDEWQMFSGTLIRSIVQDGVKPPRLIFRPEVFDLVMECAEKYGLGSPFVTDEYLEKRTPVFNIPPLSA